MNPATPTWDCTEARPSLGVYVLGATNHPWDVDVAKKDTISWMNTHGHRN